MHDPSGHIRQFYRRQAALYDSTRWAFLYGRKAIIAHLPGEPNLTLLEVGCGTGYNLRHLARRRPSWRLTGLDMSPDMLRQAARATAPWRERVTLIERAYGLGQGAPEPVDIILFSYALTLFNPGWDAALEQAWRDLKPGGHIAVVDFHDSSSPPLLWWMKQYHVCMDGHLLPALNTLFEPVFQSVQPAWFGMWRYFMFVGQPSRNP